MSARAAFLALLRRDCALAWAGGGAATPIGFYLGAVTLLPLAIGADRVALAQIGAPLAWLNAALAALLSLERLFQADLEDGGLDQLLLSAAPPEILAAAKGLALWIAVGLPLTLASAPIALALQTPPAAIPILMLALAIGMAAFFGIGLMGAALAAGVRRGGLLIALIVLPFFAPPVIFGSAAAAAAAGFGQAHLGGALSLLGAYALAACAIGPIAAAAALRLHVE